MHGEIIFPGSRRSKERENDKITLIFDTKLFRPGCVLIQAMGGCAEHNSFLQAAFEGTTWLLAPTPNMKLMTGTRKEWEEAAKIANAANP